MMKSIIDLVLLVFMFWLGYRVAVERTRQRMLVALASVSVENVAIEWDPLLKPGQTVSDKYKVMVLKSRMLAKLEEVR